MKTLLLILALVAAPAAAQTVLLLEPDGRLTKQCGAVPRVPPLALPAPMDSAGLGVPKQLGGPCTEAIMTADGRGGAVGYWCAQSEPEGARLYLFAAEWDKITMPMVLDFSAMILMSDKTTRITDMHKKYQSLNIRDMCDIWNPLVDRLNAIYPAPLPALKQWVAVGGTVFASNGTVLTGITAKKVAAGVACLSNVPPIVATEKVYYPIVVGSTERVLCRQATP